MLSLSVIDGYGLGMASGRDISQDGGSRRIGVAGHCNCVAASARRCALT